MGKKYTEEEIQIITIWYPLVGAKAVAKRLQEKGYKRTYKNIVIKAFHMRLKSPLNHKKNEGSFKKGQTSPNKGKKMTKEVYQKAQTTMFKKGDLPHNTKHDGYISIRSDTKGKKYKYIRIRKGKWVQLHRYVWEQQKGPIPKGMIIIFKDKDSMNCDINNLQMISRAENARRNYNREKVKKTNEKISDKQIVGRLARQKPELKKELFKNPDLLDVARKATILNREIKKITNE
jgi:hypothetical protein